MEGLKRGKTVRFQHWTCRASGEWKPKWVTAKVTYIHKALGPLGISIVPQYFWAIVGEKREMFWCDHITKFKVVK